jgi:hypothetical protein
MEVAMAKATGSIVADVIRILEMASQRHGHVVGMRFDLVSLLSHLLLHYRQISV